MSIPSYLPGEAYAVVNGDVAILVDTTDAALVADLWEVSGATDVLAILDRMGAAGFSAMPEFAAVVRARSDVRVITRGTGTVQLLLDGETSRCDAAGVSTWSEQRLPADGVSGLTLTLGAPSDEAPLPLVAGVVRAATVRLDPVPAEEAPSVESAPAEESAAVAESVPAAQETPGQAPAAVDPAQTMVEPDEASFDALFGATIAGRRPEDAAVRELEENGAADPAPATPTPAPPAPISPDSEASSVGDHDNHTMTPAEFARLRSANRGSVPPVAPPPDAPAPVPPPPAAPVPRATLTLSTGREVVLDRPALVGRSPQARNTSSAQLPHLVVIDDPYISGTHLELSFVGNELRGTDVSTNGTMLRRTPEAAPTQLTKGVSTPVPDGAVLVISDGISISVSLA